MINERIETDILVIGAGGAGMMAAISAREAGAQVCLVTKSRAMRGGATVMAPGAIAAVDDAWKSAGDSVRRHIEDTLLSARGLADSFLVTQTAEMAGSIIRYLESSGALFQRTGDGGTLALRTTGGHSFYRSPFVENRVGREICRTLWGQLNRLGIQVVEQVMLTQPLFCGGRLCGAEGLDLRGRGGLQVTAKSTIIATGGAGYIYSLTDNPNDLTGDGYALALRAGAKLTDMEFVQFYPMGFVYPRYARGQVAGFPAYVRLYNGEKHRFMADYDPSLELATRDRICFAIASEVNAGRGSPHGGVYCGMDHLSPGSVERELPGLSATYQAAGIDPYRDWFEVGPSAHFFQGGVQVSHTRESNVKGLYAVGEAAAGMHGANRLGQNALTDILVSGYMAGIHAACGAPVSRDTPSRVPVSPYNPGAGCRETLRTVMHRQVGVIRTEASLAKAESTLEELLSEGIPETDDIPGWSAREAAENRSMLYSAICVTQAARLRRESRGCHFRTDHPLTDSAWQRHTIASMLNGKIVTATELIHENNS